MADAVSKIQRSAMMSRVRGRDTGPEIAVRSVLHRAGYRFRLHRRDLPGTPDIVLPAYRTCIFVNGCFWHQHNGCAASKRPTTNVEFWNKKLDRTIQRDQENLRALQELGWKTIVLWECEIRDGISGGQLLKQIRLALKF